LVSISGISSSTLTSTTFFSLTFPEAAFFSYSNFNSAIFAYFASNFNYFSVLGLSSVFYSKFPLCLSVFLSTLASTFNST
jgi:hypothetical protein